MYTDSYNPHTFYYGPDRYYDDGRYAYGYGGGKGKWGKHGALGPVDESESAEGDTDTKVEKHRRLQHIK